MPFLGVNDIVAIVRLAWHIQDIGSNKYTSAPQEFSEFLGDVHSLARTFDAVRNVFQAAHNHRTPNTDDEFVQATIKEAQSTLRSCENLIQNNAHFQKDETGYIVNIVWALTIADHVRREQSRIQICFHRANLVLQLIADDSNQYRQELALTDSQSRHDETHQMLRVLLGLEQPIEADISTLLTPRISECFVADIHHQNNGVPDVLGRLNLLHSLVEQSTLHFQSRPPSIVCPSPTQYLNLLKSIWLLNNVVTDPDYQSYCVRSPFNRAWARSLERKITIQARRFFDGPHPLERVDEETVLRQRVSAFAFNFWQNDRILTMLSPLEANGAEELEMSTTLRAIDNISIEELKVFRVAEDRIRIARIISRSNPAIPQQIDRTISDREINCRSISLVPIYALSNDENAVPSISWKASYADQISQELPFVGANDARRFQQIVTGFRVVYNHFGILSAHKKAPLTIGHGRVFAHGACVQIWIHQKNSSGNDVANLERASSTPTTHSGNSSSRSPQSRVTWTETERINDEFSSVQSRAEGAFFVEPVPGHVIILSEWHNKKMVTSIRIDEKTKLAPNKCDCSINDGHDCREAVLESARGRLKLRTSIAGQSEGWNVAVFGYPEHRDAKLTITEELKFLSIQFQNAKARQAFSTAMKAACSNVRYRMEGYYRDLHAGRRMSLHTSP